MRKSILAALLCTGLILHAGSALALKEGKTTQGEPYVSGGVGAGEEEALVKQRGRYTLRVLTAASKSGAYLADAAIRIVDTGGKAVLEATADGPWLYVNLKPGDYKVNVSFGGQTKQQSTRIQPGDHHELFFYFDAPVERLPKDAKK